MPIVSGNVTIEDSRYSSSTNAMPTSTNTTTMYGQADITFIDNSCSGINSFPYNESFEAGEGNWNQEAGDDINWTRHSGSTGSGGTGPSSASDGSFYMYTEASSPNYPSKIAMFTSDCINLSGEASANFDFDYHMYGGAMGTLKLQIESPSESGNWVDLWSLSGDQGNAWNTQSVSLNAYVGNVVKLRFHGTTGSGYTSDMAIDKLSITTGGGGGSCPALGGVTPNAVTITSESSCNTHGGTPSGGVLSAATNNCPTGSSMKYSTNGGATWSSSVPTYNQSSSLSVLTVCECNTDANTKSPTTSLSTSPESCPTCVDGIQNGDETGVDCGGSTCPSCVAGADHFITTWKTDNSGATNSTSIRIPIIAGSNFDVDWNNDGTFDEFGLTGNVTHDFGTAGTYTIRMKGTISGMIFSGFSNDCLKFIEIKQWGSNAWSYAANAFNGCKNLQYTASDLIKMNSAITNMSNMFYDCFKFDAPLNHLDVQNVTNFGHMFDGALDFNHDISNWNTSSADNMTRMFYNAHNFNQDISGWDVSNVTDMQMMFDKAVSFNQPIGSWNVSSLQNPLGMFGSSFDRWPFLPSPPHDPVFNQDLGAWNTASVTNMQYMFNGCKTFNYDIGNWNTENVVSMSSMFGNCYIFNQDIGSWNTQNVVSMAEMFAGARNFNQDIGNWNTSKVVNMSGMLKDARSFDQDIGDWNVSSVTNMESMFYADPWNSCIFNQDISGWNTSNVRNMGRMFMNHDNFNQDIGGWDVSSVQDFSYTFVAADIFSQDLSNWNTSSADNMEYMFYGCSAFDYNLGNWDISGVSNMTEMFSGAGLSVQNYDNTLIGWAATAAAKNESFEGSTMAVQPNVPLGASGLEYCAGESARDDLINTHGWVISNDAKNCPLPINLLDFNAKLVESKVELDWTTSSEINNDHFMVQRSLDGHSWEDLQKIAGAGNSNSQIDYFSLDQNPLEGKSFYRIQQTDHNGKSTFSEMRIIHNNGLSNFENLVTLFPNPARDFVTIKDLKNTSSIKIFNELGQEIFIHPVLLNSESVLLDISELATGTYHVKAEDQTIQLLKR
jgi:surface protein